MCLRSAQVPSESLLEHLIFKIFLGEAPQPPPPTERGPLGPPSVPSPWDAFGVSSGASRHILSLTKFLGTPPAKSCIRPWYPWYRNDEYIYKRHQKWRQQIIHQIICIIIYEVWRWLLCMWRCYHSLVKRSQQRYNIFHDWLHTLKTRYSLVDIIY